MPTLSSWHERIKWFGYTKTSKVGSFNRGVIHAYICHHLCVYTSPSTHICVTMYAYIRHQKYTISVVIQYQKLYRINNYTISMIIQYPIIIQYMTYDLRPGGRVVDFTRFYVGRFPSIVITHISSLTILFSI